MWFYFKILLYWKPKKEIDPEFEEYKKNKKRADSITLFNKRANELDLDNSTIYKKAHLSKSTFSKWYTGNNIERDALILLAFALNMNSEEAKEFLKLNGYYLSPSKERDLYIMYCFDYLIHNIDARDKIGEIDNKMAEIGFKRLIKEPKNKTQDNE